MTIKIHEKDADNNTLKKCVILAELSGKEQEKFEFESVEMGTSRKEGLRIRSPVKNKKKADFPKEFLFYLWYFWKKKVFGMWYWGESD